MSGFLSWFRKPTTAERLRRFGLRPDTMAAAQLMVSDHRSDALIGSVDASLTEAETVLRMTDGRHDGDRGLLVLTSQRVFFRSRRSDGPVTFSVRLDDVRTIAGSTRRVVGTVRIVSADGEHVVDDILGTQGEMLADEAQLAIRGESRPPRDPLKALDELRTLRDRGEISAAEFETRKSELWGSI